MKNILLLSLVLLLAVSCTTRSSNLTSTPEFADATPAIMSNPASVYCEEQGFVREIRTSSDGSQTGYCVFSDDSECDEWMFFRGECGPSGSSPQPTPETIEGWKVYRNETLGYSFLYPADATIEADDNPLNSLSIFGSGMGDEMWTIAHPADRDEFRPPQGVDLKKWLADHYLTGEKQMPDTQIAGTLAIHYRHDRTPQSYASDRYFFAKDGQLFEVLIGHGGETEDWDLNIQFLQSFQFVDTP